MLNFKILINKSVQSYPAWLHMNFFSQILYNFLYSVKGVFVLYFSLFHSVTDFKWLFNSNFKTKSLTFFKKQKCILHSSIQNFFFIRIILSSFVYMCLIEFLALSNLTSHGKQGSRQLLTVCQIATFYSKLANFIHTPSHNF